MKKLHTYIEGLLDADVADLTDVEEIAKQEEMAVCLMHLHFDKKDYSIKNKVIKLDIPLGLSRWENLHKQEMYYMNEFFKLAKGYTIQCKYVHFEGSYACLHDMNIEDVKFESELWSAKSEGWDHSCNFHFKNCTINSKYITISPFDISTFENVVVCPREALSIDSKLHEDLNTKRGLKKHGIIVKGNGEIDAKFYGYKSL